MNAARRIIAAGLALAAMNAMAETATPAALRICLPSDDAPRSDRAQAAGLDIDVARLLARRLDRPLQLVWLPELGEIDEVSDFNFRPLLRGACDAHLSVPGIEGLGAYRNALALSDPYYGAAYELVPASAQWQWGTPAEETIAVMANSVAHVAIDAAGLGWSMRPNTAEIVRAVSSGEAGLGLIWGPDLGAFDIARAATFAPPPVLRWNLHAATRRDDALVAEINRVFGDPADAQHIQAILTRHGVPARPPFDTVYTPEALRAVSPR